MKKMMMAAACAALSVAMISCATKSAQTEQEETTEVTEVAVESPSINGEWVIESVGEMEAKAGFNAPSMTFVVDSMMMNGQTGCNSFFGALQLDEEAASLSFGTMGSTKMACGETAAQEDAILAAAAAVKSYAFSEGKLLLLDAEGNTLLTLVEAVK